MYACTVPCLYSLEKRNVDFYFIYSVRTQNMAFYFIDWSSQTFEFSLLSNCFNLDEMLYAGRGCYLLICIWEYHVEQCIQLVEGARSTEKKFKGLAMEAYYLSCVKDRAQKTNFCWKIEALRRQFVVHCILVFLMVSYHTHNLGLKVIPWFEFTHQ